MKHKYDDIFIEDKKLLTLTYDVFEGNTLYRVVGNFEKSGIVLKDPYIIALSLLSLSEDDVKSNKKQLDNKKILQFYRNEIPYERLFYYLTGGDFVWTKIKWDFYIVIDFWRDQFNEMIKDCFTIYDLIIFYNYFKNDVIVKSFNDFLSFYRKQMEQKNMKE